MIKYKVGDLIEAMKNHEVDAIAHQANCFHKMKSGIAPQIARAWSPAVTLADEQTEYGSRGKMGYASRAFTEDGLVFNIYGQYHWNRNDPEYGTSYEHLASGFKLVRTYMDLSKITHLGIPLIGCGLAGGDWGIVSGLIEEVFKDWPGQITVYTLTLIEGLDYGLAQ